MPTRVSSRMSYVGFYRLSSRNIAICLMTALSGFINVTTRQFISTMSKLKAGEHSANCVQKFSITPILNIIRRKKNGYSRFHSQQEETHLRSLAELLNLRLFLLTKGAEPCYNAVQ